MAQLSDISINVGIAISEETINRCCQLLSLYLTDHPDKKICQYDCGYNGRYVAGVGFETKEGEKECRVEKDHFKP